MIAALMLLTALQGLRRGVAATALGALSVIVAYLVASVWYPALATVLKQVFLLPSYWVGASAFVILLVSAYAAMGIFIFMVLGTPRISAPSRVWGAIVGVFHGTLLSMALVAVVLGSPFGDDVEKDVQSSLLAPYVAQAQQAGVNSLAAVLPHTFGAKKTRF